MKGWLYVLGEWAAGILFILAIGAFVLHYLMTGVPV